MIYLYGTHGTHGSHGAHGAQGGSRVGRAPHRGDPPGGATTTTTETTTTTTETTTTETTTNIPTPTTPHAPAPRDEISRSGYPNPLTLTNKYKQITRCGEPHMCIVFVLLQPFVCAIYRVFVSTGRYGLRHEALFRNMHGIAPFACF